MTLLAPSLDYTSVDFDALRARLLSLVESVFPEWTDHDVAGFGNLLVEMFAFVGDVLGYYLDTQAREAFLSTALRRENVIALARRLGYRMAGATAATAELEVRLSAPPRARVLLAAGSMVRTREAQNPARFQVLQDLTFMPGVEPVQRGLVQHSAGQRQVFDVRSLRGSDLRLDRTPFLDRSTRVTASNGTYTEVESLLSSTPNDRHYVVFVDQHDRATLRFGDGRLGMRPMGSIEVHYKTGGGAAGNVDAGQITVFDGVPKDVEGQPVSLTLTNPARASGGSDRESIGAAKELAPLSVRATTRSVAREDFEIHAREVPGVARALMVTSNEDAAVRENAGVLYVIPKGGGLPTQALKDLVRRQVTEVYPCTLTFQVDVRDPVYKRVDLRARVFPRAGERPEIVRDRIRARLEEFFLLAKSDGTATELVDFGYYLRDNDGNVTGELPYSDLYNLVRDTPGVRKVGDHSGDLLLNGLAADVQLRAYEFPVLGSVELTDGTTGRLL